MDNTIVEFGVLLGIAAALVAIAAAVVEMVRAWPSDPRRARRVLVISAGTLVLIVVLATGGTILAMRYTGDQTQTPTPTASLAAATVTTLPTTLPTATPTHAAPQQPTATPTRQPTATIIAAPPRVKVTVVPATTGAPGVDSGLSAQRGAHLSIKSTGRAQYGSATDCGAVTQPYTDPDGQRYSDATSTTAACSALYEGDAILPSAPVGSLLARIGTSGAWFVVGSQYSGSASATGELYLVYNDGASYYFDNAGDFSVTVSVQP